MSELKVVTFNARGLKDRLKRRSLFRFLHVNYADHIVALQEVHWSTHDIPYIRNEWGAPVYCAPGHNAHVAILIPRGLIGECDITELQDASTERSLVLHIDLKKNLFMCCLCTYAAAFAATS